MSRARPNGRDHGHQVRRGPERAVIAALRLPRQRRWEVDESLEELAGLAVAAGATVVQRVTQERESPTPALYFGRGKIEEIAGDGPVILTGDFNCRESSAPYRLLTGAFPFAKANTPPCPRLDSPAC